MERIDERSILVVVDMQHDFVDGVLGSHDAQNILEDVNARIAEYERSAGATNIYYTMDTHDNDYLQTAEGRNLPIKHCIKGSAGWELACYRPDQMIADNIIFKPTFGSIVLGQALALRNVHDKITSIEIIGVCTDICVIANAILLKTFLPECDIRVNAACCAGTSKENHDNALASLAPLQITVIQ